MSEQRDGIQREVLPIPDRPARRPRTYDAKDPDTAYPPIDAAAPAAGRAERAGGAARRRRVRRVERLRRPGARRRRRAAGGGGAAGSPGSTPPRCVHRPGRRCCRGATTTPSGWAASPRSPPRRPATARCGRTRRARWPRRCKLNGYSTAQFGKCHEVPGVGDEPDGAVRQLADRRRRVRVLLRLHRRRDQPVRPGAVRGHHAGRAGPDAGGGLPPHRGHDRPRDRLGPPAEGADAGQAVLRLLRPRRHARPASRPGGVVAQVPRPVRPRLGHAARGDLRPPEGARA